MGNQCLEPKIREKGSQDFELYSVEVTQVHPGRNMEQRGPQPFRPLLRQTQKAGTTDSVAER